MKKNNYLLKIKAATRRLPLSIYLHGIIQNIRLRSIIDLLLVPIGIINYIRLNKKKYSNIKNEIAIVAIIKNEASYIKEWIDYHRLIGVNKFYLYDNESKDNLKSVLKPYIDDEIVVLNKIKGNVRQNDAYNDALNKYGVNYKYFIVLDADEFIFIKNPQKKLFDILNDKFDQQKNVGGIGINWIVFGSAGKTNNNGLVTQSFLYRSNKNFIKNQHIKTVCKPQKVLGFLNPHFPIYIDNYYSVDTIGEKFVGPFVWPPKFDDIRINHYFTKSKKEFLKKRKRGMADNNRIRNISEFDEFDKNDVFDNSMERYKDLI